MNFPAEVLEQYRSGQCEGPGLSVKPMPAPGLKLVCIPTHAVMDIWPRAAHGIDKMIEKGLGLTTAHDCLCKALDGSWLLFIMEQDGEIVLTALAAIEQGTKKVFTVVGAWGTRMDDWVELFYTSMVRIAQEQGCDSISITGRRGWAKFLLPYGFTEQMVTMVKGIK